MRKHWKGAAAVFAALAVIVVVTGCAGGQQPGGQNGEQPAEKKGPVTVGSKIDTEGELLATMIQLVLEDGGFEVEDKSQTGTTDVVRKALLDGEIDIYPEYTGSGFVFFEGNPEATLETFKDPQKGYDTVKKLDEANEIVWLTPAKANNTWAVAVKKDFAEENDLANMSDFAKYAKADKPVKFAASDEFFNNADAWLAFAETYDIELTDEQKVIFSGGNTAQTEGAVAEGTEGVNFGMAYGTDGALADLGLVVLEDDKEAQPVYWPTPIIRADTLEQYPGIEEALAPVFDSLTLEKLQELNARIQVRGEAAEAVARDYLEQGGFIGE